MAAPVAHDEGGSGFGTAIVIAVIAILVLMFVFGMSDTPDVSGINIEYFFDKFATFGENKLGWNNVDVSGTLHTIRMISGAISLFFAGLAFWLFLRLLEMEGEHADHVYHHAVDDHEVHHETGQASFLNRLMYGEDADIIEHNTHGPSVVGTMPITQVAPEPPVKQEKIATQKWMMVIRHAKSANPSDWRLAIIEADTILDALTEEIGLSGITLGERLKAADKGNFRTLHYAWEAHTVRNRIAHEGSDFKLSERDRDHVLRSYEEVFREFDYI